MRWRKWMAQNQSTQETFPFPAHIRSNEPAEDLRDFMQAGVSRDNWQKEVRVSTGSMTFSPTQWRATCKLHLLWIKHAPPHCLRRDGHSNILEARENGFLSRLFMVKILYSFYYNKTSITLWVNGMGRWGRQSAAQCNNNCASALNEPRKRAGSCRY